MIRRTGIPPLDGYVEAVWYGHENVCRWVELAVERHLEDLERQYTDGFPYYFDRGACLDYVRYFSENLQHFDGVFAGTPIEFEPWQYFAWGSAFGWLEKDPQWDMPIRRFNELIMIVPKKQGKSIIVAGSMIYLIKRDQYPGAQVYALATSQNHAKKLGYRDAEKMVEGNPKLKSQFRVNHSAGDRGIYCDEMGSFVVPQTSKPESSDGLKVHGVANDEIKDWDDFEIYDVLADGTSTDPNSMIINITTAGDNTESLGYERQRYLEKILSGQIDDDKTFGVIYGIDEEDKDNWDSLEVAKKANPNYGVSVPESYYKERIKKAKQSKRSKAVYLTKQLNQWGYSTSGWLDLQRWDECREDFTLGDLNHLPCVMAVDLSSKIDLTEVKLLFFEGYEQEDARFWSYSRFYLPEKRLQKTDDQASDAYRDQLNEWHGQGYITVCGEETIDYSQVKADIKDYFKRFDVNKIAFDPWNAQQTMNDLQEDGMPVSKQVEYTQSGYKNWSEPMKWCEALILEGRIAHDGNPVMRWCMGNVGVKEDINQNIRPTKLVDTEKIDGAVTLIMGIGTHLFAVEPEDSSLSPAARRALKRQKAEA